MTRDITWHYREGTSDLSVINSTAIHDEYGLHDLPKLSGWALDIGAHIGSVCVPLALDHPDLMVIAVEALPANVEMLKQNVEANGLGGRVLIEAAALTNAVGTATVYGDFTSGTGLSDEYVSANRFIGNVVRTRNHAEWSATPYEVPSVSLSSLLDGYGIDEVAFTKSDCETCEWDLLADPAVSRLRYIVGEYHDRGEDDVFDLLAETHHVTTFPAGEAIGMFMAVAL